MFSSVICEVIFISDNPSLGKLQIEELITCAVLKENVNAQSRTNKTYSTFCY